MKKLLLTALCVLCVLTFAFASNYQKIYSIDDAIFTKIQRLCVLNGLGLPSSTGPWSGSELMDMVNRLDTSKMSDTERAWYDEVLSELQEDSEKGAFDVTPSLNLEANIHTNTSTTFQGRDNWVRDFNKADELLKIEFDNHIRENFYGYFEFTLGPAIHYKSNDAHTDFGDTTFSSNIMFVGSNDMKQLDFNFPHRAFVAAGGEGWTFQIGRDRLSWGNGTTGNMVIGDQVQYHNMARFATWTDTFKWTFLVSSFPHPQNYYDDTGMHINGVGNGQSHYMNGISAFIGHRLEWSLFKNRLGLNLTEGVMYMSKDNRIDLTVLTPSMLYHNNYTRSNTNSILSFGADYTIMKGLNVYGELAIDESMLPGEPVAGNLSTGLAEPSAIGFVAGATYVMTAGNGILSFNVEAAQTDPYLYLRDGDVQVDGGTPREQTVGDYGINYVVAVREMIGAGGTEYYDQQFLGYRYGNDAQVANLRVSYLLPVVDVTFNTFFMRHGTYDKWTVWTRVNKTEGDNVSTPTTTHQYTANNNDTDLSDRTAVESTLVCGLAATWRAPLGFRVFGQADFVSIWNVDNVSSDKPAIDTQITLGVSWEY